MREVICEEFISDSNHCSLPSWEMLMISDEYFCFQILNWIFIIILEHFFFVYIML